MAQAERNKNEIKIAEGNYIIDIRRADEQEVYEKAVGAEDDSLVSFDRMIENLESSLDEI